MSSYEMSSYEKQAKPYRAPKPLAAPRPRVKGTKAEKDCYDLCHRAWRAGIVDDWYFGRRSPADPTVIWELNGCELPTVVATVSTVREIMAARSVASIEWGDYWCGYRALVVTLTDGRVLVDRLESGAGIVLEESAVAS